MPKLSSSFTLRLFRVGWIFGSCVAVTSSFRSVDYSARIRNPTEAHSHRYASKFYSLNDANNKQQQPSSRNNHQCLSALRTRRLMPTTWPVWSTPSSKGSSNSKDINYYDDYDTEEDEPMAKFSPAYLEQIDKYRGYRRKILLRKMYHNVTQEEQVNTTVWGNFVRHVVSERMLDDLHRRKKVYLSDWMDGLKKPRKTIPAILFLYFACLSPAVSFGTIASQITQGSMGIVEFLLSAGLSGEK